MQVKLPITDSCDFAILGHQERWENVYAMVNQMRGSQTNQVVEEEIRYIFPFFPARSLFKIDVTSTLNNKKITGCYVETFIGPDSLVSIHLKENIQKVKEAAFCANTLGAPIATLGGFTSIVLEGQTKLLPAGLQTVFTTGNTLTAAFIVQNVKDACQVLDKDISQSHIIVIGATGDIGSACVNYFAGKSAQLTLVARNKRKLFESYHDLSGTACTITDSVEEYASEGDIIIAAASSSSIQLHNLKTGTLVIDAGYPKNIDITCIDTSKIHFLYGGMGYVCGNIHFYPDYRLPLYHVPSRKIAHGCILEAVVLAFENKHYAYSQGRGQITLEKMEEILLWANKHGIIPAPFYNHQGLWSIQKYTYGE
ncbi:hypothetical protein GXP67_04260 [Rhodocytophaga rosea]|uniref:Quinate/shikimate 5-dehydrogenase/glutamyl-tRNA reductase domain-containing protein n=1 Tax=Rhodocytophaga rosea TaxID=2704465 RepID=A0A6C0GDE2_9BACT|nr:hypothetical protein [Rhodocytophaga rosea]QHT65937.1 hypothetical protein GXP67_04260 [Rhodocytophaga rosea]